MADFDLKSLCDAFLHGTYKRIRFMSLFLFILAGVECLLLSARAWMQPWAKELWSQFYSDTSKIEETPLSDEDDLNDQIEDKLPDAAPIRVPRISLAIVLTIVALVLNNAWLTPPKETAPESSFDLQSRVFDIVLFASVLLPLVTSGTMAVFGMHLRNLRDNFKAGLTGFWLSILPTLFASLFTLTLRRDEHQHPLLKTLSEHPTFSNVLGISLVAVVFAPVVEELMFRVVLQNWLKETLPKSYAVLITAGLFAGVHGPDAVPLIPLSLILGLTYLRTGSYLSVVVTHSLFNAANILMLVASPK